MPNGNGELIIKHHGATQGVTGSCHELVISSQSSILIDCGLFQGNESRASLNIEFDIVHIAALIVTHVHIDHVGRIPYLLAAGFKGRYKKFFFSCLALTAVRRPGPRNSCQPAWLPEVPGRRVRKASGKCPWVPSAHAQH